MTLRKILVPFQDDGASLVAFQAALQFARPFAAHVEAVHIRQRLQVPISVYYPIAVAYVQENAEVLKDSMAAAAAGLRAKFEAACAHEGVVVTQKVGEHANTAVTASWFEREGDLPFDLSTAARASDIIFLARPLSEPGLLETDIFEDLLFQSGRPVILTAERTPAPLRCVLVAWNGKREAARAVGAALPVLQAAGQVHLVVVGDLDRDAESADRLKDFLSLHAVNVAMRPIQIVKGVDAEDAFLAEARALGADLIVMGAYSHSRWKQLVLGGFTRRMLKESEIPLLMSH